MSSILAHSRSHIYWSSFALFLTFTFIVFYSSNPFLTKHQHALIYSHKDIIQEECKLFEGKWVWNPEGVSMSSYTDGSCPTLPDSKNCFKYGRVDTEFLNWRWKPNECELPSFDPANFLRIVKGKTMGFVGDSVAGNHADSLICLLSKEEVPVDIHRDPDDKFHTWRFPNHNFTLVTLWSRFIIAADEPNINGSESVKFILHLDRADHNWTDQLPTLDYAIISSSHWFNRPVYLYQNNIKIGCVYCNEPNTTNYDMTFALRMAFRTALKYINECTGCKSLTTLIRTISPAHFENGTWNNGGTCNRVKPTREFEFELSEYYRGISVMQTEEIEMARKECSSKNKRFEVLDITGAMLMRADGHPDAHYQARKWSNGVNDCVHWCLPGPIDVWNEFLMAHLNSM